MPRRLCLKTSLLSFLELLAVGLLRLLDSSYSIYELNLTRMADTKRRPPTHTHNTHNTAPISTTMSAVADIRAADRRRREIILPAVSASLQRSNRSPTPLLVEEGVKNSQGGGADLHGLRFVGVPRKRVFIEDQEAVKGTLTVLAKIARQYFDAEILGLRVSVVNHDVLKGLIKPNNHLFDEWVSEHGDDYLNGKWLRQADCQRVFDILLKEYFDTKVAAARTFLVQEEMRTRDAAAVAQKRADAEVVAAAAAAESAQAADEEDDGGEDGHAQSGEESDGSNEDDDEEEEEEDGEEWGSEGEGGEEEEERSGAQDLEAAKERVGRFFRSPLKEELMQGLR